MARIKGNKTTFSSSINTELYNKLKVRAQKQGVSFSYLLQVCASVGYNVLDGKETKSAVQSAVRDEMTPALTLVAEMFKDLNMQDFMEGLKQYGRTKESTNEQKENG